VYVVSMRVWERAIDILTSVSRLPFFYVGSGSFLYIGTSL